MIQISNIEVFGMKSAMRGMRYSHRSEKQGDTEERNVDQNRSSHYEFIGSKDLILASTLFKEGEPNRKYLRMINIWMTVKAPLYWWKEYDTYKVGTVANSDSTMHNLTKEDLTIGDFSHEYLGGDGLEALYLTIQTINAYREKFHYSVNEEAKEEYFYNMVQLLPSSYLQKRELNLNYEVAINIIKWRRNHKLHEWRVFCNTLLKECPYLKTIIEGDALKEGANVSVQS